MNLKTLRTEKKLSQNQLSNALKIPQKTYSNYETNICEPSIETLIKLADFYDVTLDYLVDRPYSNTYGYLSDEEKELISNYRNMTQENKIVALAETRGILASQNNKNPNKHS